MNRNEKEISKSVFRGSLSQPSLHIFFPEMVAVEAKKGNVQRKGKKKKNVRDELGDSVHF